MKVDLDLVRKYNVSGPRYTSYPPAPHFTALPGEEPVLAEMEKTNTDDRPISLYFHLPFCKTLCWYCGCNTVITKRQSQSAEYLEYLEKELEMVASRLNPKRKVVQLHFGGGTPTFLQPEEIRRLGSMIRKHFTFADNIEAGVEIDPRRMTYDHVAALREAGFNRASIGIQDHNPEVQKAVNRIQPKEMTERVVRWCREAGFPSISVDLIYGLPCQTPETFEQTLDEVLAMQPDRFAVFSYAHVPWIKPAQKILDRSDMLPSPETKFQLLKLSVEKITAAGYVYIGMDHFAKATDELAIAQQQKTLQRNFQGYSTRGGADIYGFGMSSISQTDGMYWQNEKGLQEYYSDIDQGKYPFLNGYQLTEDDRVRRVTIMRLMCDMSLDYPAMSRMLDVDFTKYFAREIATLDDLEADGLLHRTPTGLEVTEIGRLLVRIIAMRFDAYLKQGPQIYSKTV